MSETGTHLSIDATPVGFALEGEIDSHTAPGLETVLSERLDSSPTTVLNVEQVSFMDSSGLRVLISATTACRSRGGDLVIESPSSIMRRLIEISGLVDHLHLTDASTSTEAEAVKSAAGQEPPEGT